MSAYCHKAYCLVCRKNKCVNEKVHSEPEEGDFLFLWEWLSRDKAIEVIVGLRCPCCGSKDWELSDGGNR